MERVKIAVGDRVSHQRPGALELVLRIFGERYFQQATLPLTVCQVPSEKTRDFLSAWDGFLDSARAEFAGTHTRTPGSAARSL